MTLELLIKGEVYGKQVVSQCCDCRRYQHKDNTYHRYTNGKREHIELNYLISHGYCEPCMEKALKQ